MLQRIIGTVLFAILSPLFLFSLLADKGSRSNVLVIDLSGRLPEDNVRFGRFVNPRRGRMTLLELVTLLKWAGTDPRIKGAIVKLGNFKAGFGALQGLRQALERFSASGKRLVAFAENCSNLNYYLLSAAGHLFMNPVGNLYLHGLHVEVTFFKELLDRIGIEAQFEQVGEFKTAFEPFTRSEMSEAHRAMMDSILDDIYTQLAGGIAYGRRMEPDQVKGLIDQGPFTSAEAEQAGLIDGRLYADELEEKAGRIIGERAVMSDAFRYYLRRARVKKLLALVRRPPLLGFLHISGPLVTGEGMARPYRVTTGATTVARLLEGMKKSPSIKGVLLSINSPGGSEVASDLIWRAVSAVSQAKPVVALVREVGASGGYYVALGARRMLAHPASLTASIGVIAGKFVLARLQQSIGVRRELLGRGAYSSIFSFSRGFTGPEREKVRGQAEAFYRIFLERVSEKRKLSRDEIEPLARGRVWTGSQAMAHGLVDRLGSLVEAIDECKGMAGIPTETDVGIVMGRQPRAFPFPRFWFPFTGEDIGSWLAGFITVLSESAVAALLPWEVEIN